MKTKNIYFLKASDKVANSAKPTINTGFSKSFPKGIEAISLEEAKEITISKFGNSAGKIDSDDLALDFIGHIPLR